MDPISSTQNQQIKDLLKLSKPKERRLKGVFPIEGYREIKRAYENSFIIKKIFFCQSLLNPKSFALLNKISGAIQVEVNTHVFSRIAYRENSDGLLALATPKDHSIDTLEHDKNMFYLIVETVEKPGNLGALLRTADAAGVNAVIVCDNNTDIYNPNVIRSSVGCLFTKKIIVADSQAVVNFMKKHEVKIFAAALQNSELYTTANFKGSSAIVMGSEADGLSQIWRDASDKIISIPMNGDIDSLNVSVSAAVLIFEAIRQRNTL